MAIADRIKDSSTTVGTGPFTLAVENIPDFQRFHPAIQIGQPVPYVAVLKDANEWEVGIGTLTAETTLTRTTVTASSNNGQAVNFSAGKKDIFCDLTAAYIAGFARADATLVDTVTEVESATVLIEEGGVAKRITIEDFILRAGVATAALAPATSLTAADLLLVVQNGVEKQTNIEALSDLVASIIGESTADNVVPSMNGTLTSSDVTSGGFTISWSAASDNVGVAGFETSINGGADYTDAGNVTSRVFTALVAATEYQVRVRAYDAAGNRSAPLAIAVTTSTSSDTTEPTMSGSLTTSDITSAGYTMNWPAGTDNVAVVGYETSTDGGTTYSNAGNVTSRVISGATASTLYNLRVRAYDAAGNRSTPLSATVTTSAPPSPTVTSVTVSPNASTLNGSTTQQFTATVNGTDSPSQSVTWSANAGSITTGGLFTAPAATSSEQTITVTATSDQDDTKSGTATVTVLAQAADTQAPTIVSVTVPDSNHQLVAVKFSEPLSGTAPATSRFAVTGRTISSVTISGDTVNVLTNWPFGKGDSINITYTPDGTNNLKDAANNAVAGFTQAVSTATMVTKQYELVGPPAASAMWPTEGTMNANNTSYTSTTNARIYIQTADENKTPAWAAQGVWHTSGTTAPEGVTYLTQTLPANAAGNPTAQNTGIESMVRIGGWTPLAGNASSGLHSASSVVAWGQAVDRYLWIYTNDGWVGVYDNKTGTAIQWDIVAV